MILDFNERLKAKQDKQESARLKEIFMTEIMPSLTASDKVAILEAMKNNDIETYKKITEPIIMRNLIMKMNT